MRKKYTEDIPNLFMKRKSNLRNNILLAVFLTACAMGMSFIVNGTVKLMPSAAAVISDTLFFLTLFFLICLIGPPAIKCAVLTVVFIFVGALFAVDATYATFYCMLYSLLAVSGAKNLNAGGDMGTRVLPASYYCIAVMVVGVIGIWLMWFFIARKQKKPPLNRRRIYAGLMCALAAGVFVCNMVSYRGAYIKKADADTLDYYASDAYLNEALYSPNTYVKKFGYANYLFKDIGWNINLMSNPVGKRKGKASFQEIKDFYQARPKKQDNGATGLLEGYNIVTILCESLDTRIIHPQLTPNLYHIMQNEITFENYYVPMYHQGATLNSEYMATVGMLAATDIGYRADFGYFYSGNTFSAYSLAGQLGGLGYDTYYFHNNVGITYERDRLIPNYGFKTVKFIEDLIDINPQASSRDSHLMDFMDYYVDCGQKFYMHMSAMSMHGGNADRYAENMPYVKSLFPNLKKGVAEYFAKAMEFDAFVGRLLQKLNDEGIADKTMVVFFPDHLNYFERKVYKYLNVDMFDKSAVHKQTLMVYVGDKDGNKTKLEGLTDGKDYMGSTIDLTPTILNLLTPGASSFDYTYFAGGDIFDGKGVVLFPDMTVSDGKNWLTIDKKYKGDPAGRAALDAAMLDTVRIYNYQKDIFAMDYFKLLASTGH